MPCFALQRFVMQCFTAQCHAMLWHATFCRARLRFAMPCSTMHRAPSSDHCHCPARPPTVRMERIFAP
eukprot:8205666-Pyramimonas_sp.AAC.1